jgi:GT2 family glycosyltransferase
LLSVIIVNYNVKHFLEQSLFSVMHSIKDIDAEVIVVDNASTDGSRDYLHNFSLQSGSPGGAGLIEGRAITFIWNEENLGFARANNQALYLAKGEYVLFLNPDTIIAEDCLSKCLGFMNAHPEVSNRVCAW